MTTPAQLDAMQEAYKNDYNDDLDPDTYMAMAEAYERAAWQPIESAPTDGTHIQLWTQGYKKIRIGWFYNNAWHWDGDYEGVYLVAPTHWRHLTPPQESSNDDTNTNTGNYRGCTLPSSHFNKL